MGQPDLGRDPRFTGNLARLRNVDELDRRLGEADIPCTPVYTAAECAADPQFRHRGMVRAVEDPLFGREILHPGIVPHVPEDPGAVRWPGPRSARIPTRSCASCSTSGPRRSRPCGGRA